MKKTKIHQDQTEIPFHYKFTENILKKNNNKQFELLYRQRDQSIEENPIESIIFVKSKSCKPASNDKKIKVHQEFNKIMNDLNAHVNQHKKSNKSQKKYISTASTQHKTPFSTKKSTKQTDFIPKKHRPNEKDQSKILKTVNKGIQNLVKEKSPNIEAVKSPKKNQKNHLSPKSKQILSPKPQKFQKENIQTKKVNTFQKIQRKKSPNQKTNRKTNNFSSFQQQQSNKKSKLHPFAQPSHRPIQNQNKTEIKRNIRSIPLKVQEYILIEDNFQRIKKRSLYKLQTKLLSTYRNNFKEFQNKLLLKENQDENDIVFEKVNRQCFEENNQNFIERSSIDSESNKSQQQQIDRASQIQDNLEIENIDANSASQYFIEKVVLIQNWWRRMLRIQTIKIYLFKNLQQNQSFKSQPKSQPQKNFTTPVNLPSAKSIQFNDQVHSDEDKDEKLQKVNEEMGMLRNQNQIVSQKKLMHQKILKNLLKQRKISKDDFENKMALVQREYERELKEIMSLYKLIEFGTRSQDQIQGEQSNEKDIKIIQGEKADQSSEDLSQQSPQNHTNYPTPQNQSQQDEIPLKLYKIGEKITSQMQNYIETTKKNRESAQKVSTQSCSNDFVCEKYNKKTNEQGEQYFEDFESDSSNDQSPHKMLSASNFQEFESQIQTDNHGSSFEPNSHFIKMLEQYKQQELVKMKIDQRIAIQMGASKSQNEQKYAVDSSILGIHQFLVNFFKFYLHYYKDEFLRFINMPYGYQPQQRLKFIQGYEDTSDELSQDSDGIIYGLEYIISDDVFDEFVEQYYADSMQNGNDHQKAIIECSKIHDRALFECFNEALNNFRPYYSISGPPYIWNCSQKTLTFYFIAQENINQVFEKTEYKIMKWASGLLGLYVDGYDLRSEKGISLEKQIKDLSIEQILSKNHSSCHPVVFEKRQENLIKEERIQLIESMSKWGDNQEQRASTLYELSSMVLEKLAQEMVIQFLIKSISHPLMEEFY